ncbi:helix-turn-helix transcriptional regulator [Halorussus salinus]|uniref:helix-turn-helix transcriptional regulator n=1 Tax=Halorussus salinus TaxID=1364935 RepID=UPI001092495C|nr:helix-turn-helix transcriptional regulator [Halorussus salinus]
MTADTVASLTDLRAFERDLLYAVCALEDDTPPKGLTIKNYLDSEYGEDLNHSRLYQNLDRLTDNDLLTKGQKDDRTNEYATTDHARELLADHAQRRASAVDLNGGGPA